MTNTCCGLVVIFCAFLSLLIGRKTINITEIFSGVQNFMGKTVNDRCFWQNKNNLIYHVAKVKAARSAYPMADAIPSFSAFIIPFESNASKKYILHTIKKTVPVTLSVY